MAKRTKSQDPIEALLADGAEQERRLLKRERRAERSLADAHSALADGVERSARIQVRLERLAAAVTTSEEELQAAQSARAAGPHATPSSAVETPVAAAVLVPAVDVTDRPADDAENTAASPKDDEPTKPAPVRRTRTVGSTRGSVAGRASGRPSRSRSGDSTSGSGPS